MESAKFGVRKTKAASAIPATAAAPPSATSADVVEPHTSRSVAGRRDLPGARSWSFALPSLKSRNPNQPVWMAAEYEGKEKTAEEISQLLYHLQVMMLACELELDDVYKYL